MTMVVSSTTSSSWCQRLVDSATTASQHAVGPLSIFAVTMSTTSWLVMNSHTPSLAQMANLSAALSSTSLSSGSAKTPTVSAARSPNDRAMASPGMSTSRSHTRGTPHSNTRPPLATMRAISSGSSGLWSRERSTAAMDPSWNCRPSTARESPTLATYNLGPRISVVMPVVPLTYTSMSLTDSFWLVARQPLFITVKGSLARWSVDHEVGNSSRTNREAFAPLGPCPSNTPTNSWSSRPANLSSTI
mmetsp:Transcript_5464/g.23100  ORF Transcript_5464/g.23100 Transcript_5464/m.23100 type:complete len:246 (+) Transcript_5464:771-1508(+)